MARTAAFDRTAVVRAACELFWDRGFDAVSLPELEQATGLNRSSLYNSFGSKRGLYDAAVSDYRATVVGPLLTRLRVGASSARALAAYLDALAAAGCAARGAAGGGLLLNSAAGLAAHDEIQRHIVDDYRAELSGAVTQALASAAPDRDAEDRAGRAQLIVAAVISAMLLARINPDEAERTVRAAKLLLA
ncbi:MAG: helix-turn-helix domain-containing protein [Mycetocola sp.]